MQHGSYTRVQHQMAVLKVDMYTFAPPLLLYFKGEEYKDQEGQGKTWCDSQKR